MSAVAAREAAREPHYGGEIRTLGAAAREFAHKRSPWLIAAGIAALLTVRVAIGEPSWRDAVAVAAMLVVYPFGEWAIHVYLLHMRPLHLGQRVFDPPAARSHREHHLDPANLGLILLGPVEAALLLLGAVPLVVAVGAALVALLGGTVPIGAAVTAALTAYVAIAIYEWTHLLIHTAYRPRSRYFRSISRSHRLHHFKNEHFWHGVTSNLTDRALGTFPDQRSVSRSATARTLGTPSPRRRPRP